jgi:hypothetical protein
VFRAFERSKVQEEGRGEQRRWGWSDVEIELEDEMTDRDIRRV